MQSSESKTIHKNNIQAVQLEVGLINHSETVNHGCPTKKQMQGTVPCVKTPSHPKDANSFSYPPL